MTCRFVYGVMVATLSTWAVLAVAPAQAQDAGLPPREESAVITVAGCLQQGGSEEAGFVLASPIRGPIASVPDGACSGPVDTQALELEDTDRHGINGSMLGMWIEINGRLEKETDDNPENLRELKVRSFRIVPVVPPQAVQVIEQPAPVAQEQPAPAPAPSVPEPVATTGTVDTTLPKTAGPLPAIGLLGLLGLTGGLMLRWRRRSS